MTYKIIVSDKAKQLLGFHIKFLANVNKESAKKTKTRIIEGIRSLEKMPARYPFLNEQYIPQNKYHKMLVENRYLIIYQIKDNAVFVDYILDCRQDYGWLIK
jgi:hypothetical protein